MSDTMEKGDTGEEIGVNVSDSARKADNTKQEDSIHSVESGGVQEAQEPASNGETLPEKMDVEMTGADEDNVGLQSSLGQSGQEAPMCSERENGDDGEVVKQGGETLKDEGQELEKKGDEATSNVKSEMRELPQNSDKGCGEKGEPNSGAAGGTVTVSDKEPATPRAGVSDEKAENKNGKEMVGKVNGEVNTPVSNGKSNSKYMFLSDDGHTYEGNDSGTEEEQLDFLKKIEDFFKERSMEFKHPKFYGDLVNCLKLYRIVTRLGGYDKVTSSKLWSQVGVSFKPPRTCTTVSYSFRGFYEKALLEYEKYETHGGQLSISTPSHSKSMNVDKPTKANKPKKADKPTKANKPTMVDKPTKVDKPTGVDNRVSGTGRTRRSAAARAMEGWHSQRLLGNGEVSEPIIKDKNSNALQKQEKQLKSSGSHKRKKPPNVDPVVKAAYTKQAKLQLDVEVSDLGPPADWVKVNVQKTKDCFEVFALVPGLLREEVRVQTDPVGRLVISGDPEHPDNPWGVTSFKKAVSLPSRIDPHNTSAVVTLHGQLYVRVPFEQSG